VKAQQKIEALDRSFGLEPYLREYSTREDLPTWYVQGWVPEEKVKAAARKLKAALGIKEAHGVKKAKQTRAA
jgi:hypothetical protein